MPYEEINPPGTEDRELTAYARSRDAILILGCDANVHHCQWGRADINKCMELMFDFINTKNLIIFNMGGRRTFRNKDRQAVIDLTLVNCDEQLVVN